LALLLLLGLLGLLFVGPLADKVGDWGDASAESGKFPMALKQYSIAGFLGNAHSQAMLADAYGSHAKEYGVQTDWATAFRWAQKSAARNDSDGLFTLGTMYFHGHHVQRDPAQAKNWFKKALEAYPPGRRRGNFYAKDTIQNFIKYADDAENGRDPSSSPAPTVRSTPSTSTTSTVSAMSVDDLEKAFKTNPKAAEATYTGKTIVVSGVVDWIGAGILDGKPAITLKARTNCSFPATAKSAVNAVKVGQKVTVRAQFDGYLSGFISLKNCELVP